MKPKAALILIDLQNEFLHPSGSFPILPDSQELLLSGLKGLVNSFRENKGLVIWVKSIYDAPKPESEKNLTKPKSFVDRTAFLLSSTHTGPNPCCTEGSFGAEIFAPISEELMNPQLDRIIIKHHYSAFKDTDLLQVLQAYGADSAELELYFAGLLSGTCVLASILDAARSTAAESFRLYAITDCLGYRRADSHQKALGKMEGAGVTLLESTQVLVTPKPPSLTIPKLYYVNGSIPSWRVQMALYEKGIPCHQIRMNVMSTPKPTRMPFFLSLNHRGKTPVFIDSDADKTTINESLAILLYLETYYTSPPPSSSGSSSSSSTSNPPSLLPPLSNRPSRAKVLRLIQETENLHYAYDALEEGFYEARDKDLDNNRESGVDSDSDMDHFVRNVRPGLLDALYRELDFWEVYASASPPDTSTSPSAETQNQKYIAGATDFSLADCAFYPILAYMRRRGFEFEICDGTGAGGGGDGTGKEDIGGRYPNLKKYYEVVWERESAKLAQPEGWAYGRCGQVNVFVGR